MVEIVARPQNFNVWALSGPAIKRDRRFYDLDGAFGLTVEIYLFQTNDSDLIRSHRAVDNYFELLPRIHIFMPPII